MECVDNAEEGFGLRRKGCRATAKGMVASGGTIEQEGVVGNTLR